MTIAKHGTVSRRKIKFSCEGMMELKRAKGSWRITMLFLKIQVFEDTFWFMEYEHETPHKQGSSEKPSTMPLKGRFESYFCS